MVPIEKELGVRDVAALADVSPATAFRWAAGKGAPAGFPAPIRRPGKPATWPEPVIRAWLASYTEVRACERAMESLGDAPELDAVLQRVARTAARLLRSTEIPVGIRQKVTHTLGLIQWEHGDKLTADDRRRAQITPRV